MRRKFLAIFLASSMIVTCVAGCSSSSKKNSSGKKTESSNTSAEKTEDQLAIEKALNLANNEDQEWTYSSDADAWVLSIVCAVTNPEIEDQQGLSVCVPGAYVKGIDTSGDGEADVRAGDAGDGVKGSLVIDYDAKVTSSNGQVYTAATAPVVVNTGAAGYSSSTNTLAATTYASEGYINMSCGNRGKQDSITDEEGNTTYTGDAPSCLVDQKNAVRYVKYNILLGNLPGSVDYFVSTGGSGGGAHATMIAATSNNPDFYDYEIEAGAVGVYKLSDGSYSTTVTIDDKDYEISDGMWGCIAYSAITSLAEADMTMAFEYYMDTTYDFGTDFQTQMAQYLSAEYMEYINNQKLSVKESQVGFDLNEDGDMEDTIDLTIEYDTEKYSDTNGYGGTYLTLYLAEFQSNLQNYLDNLDYAEGWTWFDSEGHALSDEEVAAMTLEDKANAFLEGRYTKSSSGGMEGGPGGDMGGAPGGDTSGEAPSGDFAGGGPGGDFSGEAPNGDFSGGGPGGDFSGDSTDKTAIENSDVAANSTGDAMDVGTPDAGTTQAAGSKTDSSNYSSFEEMLEAYQTDIAELEAGDQYGNNIVELYDPLNYIGAEDTNDSTWVRILMGASEGDMSMFSSLNLQIAMLNAGVDCEIEWQWDGGHVPSEILGDSLSLYLDEMYGEYVEGAVLVTKPEAEAQTTNGDSTEASGTDLTSWVDYTDGSVSFRLADAVAYRTKGASKAIPGFDVIDYGQEDYVFGDSDQDARHWDKYVLKVLEENQESLSQVFRGASDSSDQ